MAEAALSEDVKYFSVISQDGRLKIWDTESNVLKQEYTPDLHLSSPPCCLQWITLSKASEHNKAGKRRSSTAGIELQCIALGTTKGKILLYNVEEAKVETVLTENTNHKQSGVTSLDWYRKYGLFSCTKDSFVYEWDLHNSSVKFKYNVNVISSNKQGHIISAIKIIPHKENTSSKYIVTASWQLRLWRLSSGVATLLRNLGHNSSSKSVLTMVSLSDKSFVIEGSRNERLLTFWDVTITPDMIPDTKDMDNGISPNKKQRKKSMSDVLTITNPTYNFVLEDSPKIVDVLVKETDGGVKLNLAASTRSGVLHYYGHMLNGAKTKPVKPSVTLHVTTDDAKPMPLLCCKFSKSSTEQDSQDITVGYEASPGRYLFERVVPDTKSKTQVLIRTDPSKDKNSKKVKNDERNKERSSNLSENNVTYVEPMGGVTRKRTEPGGKIEVPMEARLANLALDIQSRSKSAVNQNLTKLLVQGLHSKNTSIIMMVLQKDDPQVARRTLAHLPAEYIPDFLNVLIELASRKTNQCATMCTWLQALIRCHSALLMASLNSPGTSDKITQLLAILTQRRSHLCQLLNVKGRLDLILSQRSSREDADEDNGAAVLEYADTSSDEEMELEHEPSEDSLSEQNFDESESEQDGGGEDDSEMSEGD